MLNAEAVKALLDTALLDEAFFVDTVHVQPAGKRFLVTIALDSFSPLTLDEIARASRIIGTLLDEAEETGQSPYTLEVTSRGVDAPLIKPHHFIHNIGRLVSLTTTDGKQEVVRIKDATEDSFTTTDDKVIAYSELESAFVQIEFSRKSSHED